MVKKIERLLNESLRQAPGLLKVIKEERPRNRFELGKALSRRIEENGGNKAEKSKFQRMLKFYKKLIR